MVVSICGLGAAVVDLVEEKVELEELKIGVDLVELQVLQENWQREEMEGCEHR